MTERRKQIVVSRTLQGRQRDKWLLPKPQPEQTRRGGKSRPASAGKESSRATKSTKTSNRTAHSPRPKRCRLREQDDDSSSSKDAEGFDDVPLMKADIPKIVEAVMNQFSKKGDDSQDEDQDNPNPHLNKYLTDVSISV